ncbi:MAG TPA: ABC transporter substrate-binding protein [Streptosporangiaceae bacterium]|nr:ABC transporter substrate-binding protein [Streptosporangiaceae bacterium]
MRLRIIGASLAAATALGLVAAGCSSGGSSGSSSSSSGSSGHVTLTYWNGFTGPDEPAVKALVNKFNQTHKNITIDMTIMPWDVFYEKLLPAYAANNGPDVVAMDTQQLPQYAAKGVFAPLTSYYSSSANDTSSLVSAATDATKVKGTQYAVPANFAPLMLYWNKTLFAKAGLSGPPTNWAQWQADAVKLTKGGSSPQYGIALAENNTIAMWPILLWENGGGVTNPDATKSMLSDPGTISAVDQWSKLVIKNGIAPKNITGAEADSLFTAQKAAMEMNGPWATTGYQTAKVDFGLAPIPAGPKKSVTLADVVGMSVNAKDSSAKQAAAETFFTWWNTASSQTYYAVHTGFVPTNTGVTAADLKANPDVADFQSVSKSAQAYELGTQYTNVETNTWEPAIEKILQGSPVTSTLSAANTQVNSYLGG